MDEIKTKAATKALWGQPIILHNKLAKNSDIAYSAILDALGQYEDHCTRGTLTPINQKALLTKISENCSTYTIEKKGMGPQSQYLTNLRKMVEKILRENNKPLCKDSASWYAHPWAWKKVFEKSAKNFSQEPFQLYQAVRKWQSEMYHGRQGAWFILTNYIRSVGGDTVPDIGLEEGDFDPQEILGLPIATVNVESNMFIEMQAQVRRASPRMFDPCIKRLEGTSMYQHCNTTFFQAISAHLRAEVTGPYPKA